MNSNNSPEISVIIPCYNQAEFLPDAVESIVAQTFENWECIVVNDGSSDNTSDVAKQLIKKYREKNIKLLEKKNEGLSVARNYGISKSAGKYILPFDSDDKLHPEMLEKTLNVLKHNNDISIVYTDRSDFGEATGIVKAGEYDFEKLKYQNHLSYCSLYKREVWEKVGGYRTMLTMEDWDFWVAAGALGFYGKRLPEPLFLYRVRNKSLFHGNAERYWEKLFSQIVLHNSSVYPRQLVKQAEKMLDYMEHQNVLISVILIIDNESNEQELENILSDLFFQSYENFEIFILTPIINDNFYNILKKFNDKKIKGIFDNTMDIFSKNKGKYITYINSGDNIDRIYPNHILQLSFGLEINNHFQVGFSNSSIKHEKILFSNIIHKKDIISELLPSLQKDIFELKKILFTQYPYLHIDKITIKLFDNKNIELTFAKIEQAINEKKFDIAESLLNNLLEIYPENNEILYNLELLKKLKNL